MSRRRRWGLALVVAFAVLAGVYGAREHLLASAGRWLDVGEPPQPSDYVMVLGGDEQMRPFVAAALVKAGFARKALASKIGDPHEQRERILPPTHEVIRQVLLHRGVAPDDVVILDRQSVHTFDETQALADFLQSVPDCRVIVVTSDFHTRRTRWVMRRVLGERAARLTFVSAPSEEYVLERWWQTERGFEVVSSEYLKLAFYLVRYHPLQVAAVVGAALLVCGAVASRRWRGRRGRPA